MAIVVHRKSHTVYADRVAWEFMFEIEGWAGARSASLDGLQTTVGTGQVRGTGNHTTWQIGFQTGRRDGDRVARPYVELASANECNLRRVNLGTQIWLHDKEIYDEGSKVMRLGQRFVAEHSPGFNLDCDDDDDVVWFHDDVVCFNIILTIFTGLGMVPPLDVKDFDPTSLVALSDDFASLLANKTGSDLSIVTRDGTEIRAHSLILTARCPVFASMLSAQMSEARTGKVHIKDVSTKTMTVLLHYFYTGRLQPGWNDDDTIVEFVNAAGKYLVTTVTDWLDKYLGIGELEVTYVVIQLLHLCGQLGMRDAESRLLQSVRRKLKTVKSCREILDVFGYTDQLVEDATLMDEEKIGNSAVWQILNAIHAPSSEGVIVPPRGLMTLLTLISGKGSCQHLETALVTRVVESVANCQSAAEVFDLIEGCE